MLVAGNTFLELRMFERGVDRVVMAHHTAELPVRLMGKTQRQAALRRIVPVVGECCAHT